MRSHGILGISRFSSLENNFKAVSLQQRMQHCQTTLLVVYCSTSTRSLTQLIFLNIAGIEVGNGLPTLATSQHIVDCLEAAGFEVLQTFDANKTLHAANEIPW